MTVPNIPITRVRYSDIQARPLLEFYLFARRYGPQRVPRGIAPEYVAAFLLSALKPDSPGTYFQRALDAMRFYEIESLSPHLQQILTERSASADIRGSTFLVQALGDLGSGADGDWAANYFDQVLLPKPGFVEAADLLLDTLLALAPHGTTKAFEARLRAETGNVQTTQLRGKLREIAENRLPGVIDCIEAKERLLRTPAIGRQAELISTYLLESDLSLPYIVEWSARLIRRDAMSGDPSGIYRAFGEAIDAADTNDKDAAFTIARASQAILYLKGSLTPQQIALYDDSHPEEFANFLWDEDN